MAAVAERELEKSELMHHSAHDNDTDFQRDVKKLVDLLSKLNPSAEEFIPSSRSPTPVYDPMLDGAAYMPVYVVPENGPYRSNDGYLSAYKKKRNGYGQVKRTSEKVRSVQREDRIKRTVYVSDIDRNITEEQLAAVFATCGNVLDCRICGGPHSALQFAFIEFADEQEAIEALSLAGTMLGYYPLRVLPSKTAILPVNPTYLPQSEGEKEMCTRTIYCTNIDKKVTRAEVKAVFEAVCGKVSRLRLLGDHSHSTRIAFVEFAEAESAIAALNCSGFVIKSLPIRVSPSKTPVRPRSPRSSVASSTTDA